MGKTSGSSQQLGTERWVPSRSLAYMDQRSERQKVLVIEYSAMSDPRRRMFLGHFRRMGWVAPEVPHPILGVLPDTPVACSLPHR